MHARLITFFQIVPVKAMKQKVKKVPKVTPSVPEGAELTVSVIKPEG